MPDALDGSRKNSHELLIDAISDRADGRDRARSSVRHRNRKVGSKARRSPAKADATEMPDDNFQEKSDAAWRVDEDRTVALLTAALEKVEMVVND